VDPYLERTMRYRLVVGTVVSLVLIAGSAAAQSREPKRGTAPPDWDKLGRSSPSASAQVLSKKDLEEMNPVTRILEKKKDLKLTEAQVAKLKEMETAGNGRDASLFEATDSLRKEMRSSGGGEDQRVKAFAAREAFTKAVTDLRANYAADAAASLAVLGDAQQPAAKELLEKQAKDADKTIEEKMRAGRRGGGPGGPPGGRPGGRPGGPPAR